MRRQVVQRHHHGRSSRRSRRCARFRRAAAHRHHLLQARRFALPLRWFPRVTSLCLCYHLLGGCFGDELAGCSQVHLRVADWLEDRKKIPADWRKKVASLRARIAAALALLPLSHDPWLQTCTAESECDRVAFVLGLYVLSFSCTLRGHLISRG